MSDPRPSPPPADPGQPRDPGSFTREQDRVDVGALHDPILRELSEPADGREPVPIWLIIIFFFLLHWGGWYMGTYSGGWDTNAYDESPRAQRLAAEGNPLTAKANPELLGKRVYANCRTCHQAEGQGTPGNYPPLAGSEWVSGDPETLARIVLDGIQGPITVGGKAYDNIMPGWRDKLSDEQVAAVLTHVRKSWGNQAGPVEPAIVERVRAETAARRTAWTAAELEAARAAKPAP